MLLSSIILISAVGLGQTNEIPNLDYLDTSVNPCDDFYQFTCGNFAKIHPKPDEQEVLDLFTLTEEHLINVGREILESPLHPEEHQSVKKVKAAYQACLEEDYSYWPESPEMQIIDQYGGMPLISPTTATNLTWRQVGEMIGRYGIPHFFHFNVNQFDPDTYILLMLPDEWENPDLFRPKPRSYEQVLAEAFKKAGLVRKTRLLTQPEPLDTFLNQTVYNLIGERNVGRSPAEISHALLEVKTFMRQLFSGGIIDKEPLPLSAMPTLAQLQNWTNQQFGAELGLNWVEFIGAIFQWAGIDITPDLQVFTYGVKSIYGIINLIRQTPPHVVKNFIFLRTFLFLAPDSNKPMRHAFYDYCKSNNLQILDRWQYCTRKILDVVNPVSLSFAVAYDYERHHFNVNKIPKSVKLITDLQAAFKDILLASDWLDEASRAAILRKVDNVMVSLAHPDFASNGTSLDDFYQNFRICRWDNYGNAQRILGFKQAYSFTKLIKKDRGFWGKSPFEVNAYYTRATNNIVVPIGILNDGYFGGDNPIVDYSRLGSIVGHEISHGFDTTGLGYNEEAFQVKDWLTNATLDNFHKKAQCLIEQYNAYYIDELGVYVNGNKTLDENIADQGGLRKAFHAFQKFAKDGKMGKSAGNYTDDQLFFITYGTMWCSQESKAYLENLVQSNAHAPSRVRVIGTLSNFDEFATAFSCPRGSPMNPEKKCKLW